ncbi:methionyl-tRNA formyltransferase [Parelusimicrobium proximum]|uniref:methionyl-tRNA formyltransferase n=1 Tax=Parelusimicrobium proximum TaxID=3228953 RepID=UPI003D162E8B
MKTIFFGTPELSIPFLDALSQRTETVLVVTQPDKPRGRGKEILPSPVKEHAQKLGIKVLSPEKLSDIADEVKSTEFDYGVAVAYGKLFRPEFLALPKLGIINIHFSLLPQLRGAAPVQYALFENMDKTGITAFWIAEGLDDGDIFLQKTCDILPSDDSVSLFNKLIPLGVDALKEVISSIEKGDIKRIPQLNAEGMIRARTIKKEETIVSFADMTAEKIHNIMRGLSYGPKAKAYITLNSTESLALLIQAEPYEGYHDKLHGAGCVYAIEREKGFLIECKDGFLWVKTLRLPGKKDINAADLANGYKIAIGDKIFK